MEYLIDQEDITGDPEYMVMLTPVAVGPDYYPEDKTIFVPERIMWRIIGIGKAYNLKFTEHISPNGFDRWVYRGQMLSWVSDELSFILTLVNDSVLNQYVGQVVELFNSAISQPNELQVAFEGP